VGSCAHSHGRGAVTWRPALTGVASLLALLTGCAVGGEVEGASLRPRAELAQEAEVAAENQAHPAPGRRGTTPPGPAARGRAGSGGKQAGAADPAASRTSTEATEATAPRDAADWDELAVLEDPAADHGDGPAYADLSRIALHESGGELAVTLTLAGTVPARLAVREVQGVGVDLFRSRSGESDYQVFLDGGRRGWRAFLQTPDGFVDFPGSFTVRGRALRVVVPWSSLGGRAEAEVSVFSDWSSGVGRLSADGTPRIPVSPG
jgi:hypothetical protein